MGSNNQKQSQQKAWLLFQLRALVLALGEKAAPSWWKSEFMNETGFRFLARIYPRTFFKAAVQAAGRAASDAHDRAVGRIGVYHLFRLPDSLELEISRLRWDSEEEFASMFRASFDDDSKLMDLLATICEGIEPDEKTVGAKKVGYDKDLFKISALKRIAGMYRQAFAQGNQCFPYFEIEGALTF